MIKTNKKSLLINYIHRKTIIWWLLIIIFWQQSNATCSTKFCLWRYLFWVNSKTHAGEDKKFIKTHVTLCLRCLSFLFGWIWISLKWQKLVENLVFTWTPSLIKVGRCKGQQKNISLSTLPCVSEIRHKTAKKLCKGKLFQLVSQGISLKEIIFAFSSEHLKINLDVRNLMKYRYMI